MNNNKYFYSNLRKDRTGSQIHDSILAYAYCFQNNLNYSGAIGESNFKSVNELSNFLNIPLPKKKIDNNAILIDTKKYKFYNNQFLNEKFINKLKSSFNYKKNSIFTIVIHIRRGDVNENTMYKNKETRYLPNSYYINIIKKVKNINKEKIIKVYSESISQESFDNFKKLGCEIYLDTPLKEVWESIINADIFIMSKSSFSFVPGIFCKGVVIYKDFWHSKLKLKNWVNVKKIKDELLSNG